MFEKMTPETMPLIGDYAPEFRAYTTQGAIHFPYDFKGRWIVFFSHPGDFTPVCTSEFIAFERAREEFEALNAALVGLSADNVNSHNKWIEAIEEKCLCETKIGFPLIDDEKLEISKLYGMIHPQADNTKTVRAVFIIDPKGIIRAILYYPMTCGRYIPEIIRLLTALQVCDGFDVATPANWQAGDDVIIPVDQKAYELSKEKQDEQGIHCHDWYLCLMKLSKKAVDEKIERKGGC